MTTSNTTTKSFSNPFRTSGNYHAIVATLQTLGSNKWHGYSKFAAKMTKWEGYKAFAAKEVRNEETGKDAEAKVLQNCKVLQRSDYGKPLHDQHACIDLQWSEGELQIRLNTHSRKPIQAGRQPSAAKAAKPQAAKNASKKAAKK